MDLLCRMCAAAWLVLMGAGSATAIELVWPLGRTVFQTNETIDLAVVRTAKEPALAPGKLEMVLTDDHASRLEFGFEVSGGPKKRTEHLHLNGWLLRPGTYQVEVRVDGQTLAGTFEVFSHVRQSSFRIVNWGRASQPDQLLVQGEDSLGFNLFYGNPGPEVPADLLRAGVDFMSVCTMSGGHQMDLRAECDWSDPYVVRGGTRRAVRRALWDRTWPNVPGVHFYDEPGLTWHKDPETGISTPHGVPSQVKAFRAAFDRDPLRFDKIDPANAADVTLWQQFNTFKLGFLDAAWKDAQLGVQRVRPDFLALTQSQYGWSAFGDGYYFNVARSLPITSGHGGYHDFGLGYFNPPFFLEMARARDAWKPCWYLPCWYGNTTPDQFRLEQYLSFQTGLQGMITPPDCDPALNGVPRPGIVESNQLFKRLGPVLAAMPPTKPPVALLYSLSQCLHTQMLDRTKNYAHALPHGQKLPLAYLAGKLIQQPLAVVLDEDVRDGTLAADHRAVLLAGLDYLDPAVIASLQDFISIGGLVLTTADCTVAIPGAKRLDVNPRLPEQDTVDALSQAGKYGELGPYTTVSKYIEGATPLARALKAELDRAKIKPVFECDVPTISATRQAQGEVEYLFAVNATPDETARNDKGQPLNNAQRAVAATLTLPADGRPVYDALLGIPVSLPEGSNAGAIRLSYRFGPGQMRVLARTARPLGGVRLAAPVIQRDLVLERAPITVASTATVIDEAGAVLSGSIPLEVRLIDPLGATRYTMYRATVLGQLALQLPLAANDPAGDWKLTARELLSGKEATVPFHYEPPRIAPALAGATARAIAWPEDVENAFRFARTFADVTIVPGTSAYEDAAVHRLKTILEPWGVRCSVLSAAEASKARSFSAEEAATWIGLNYAGRGQIQPGSGNPPALAGFAVRGPVILLGNADDNPLIKFLQDEHFLPFRVARDKIPGAGRGLLAWQRDGIGPGQESITLIAHDAEGLSEAIGTFAEAIAGQQPLTRWNMASGGRITPASKDADVVPSLDAHLLSVLPDRIDGLKIENGTLTILAHDGTQFLTLGQQDRQILGANLAERVRALATPVDPAQLAAAQKWEKRALVKFVVRLGDLSAVAYWGGRLDVRDAAGGLRARSQMPQDITALAADGHTLYTGLADGRVFAVERPK